MIKEPERQCLICNSWAHSEPVELDNGRLAMMCSGCGRWFPKWGAESIQGARTTWHRLMHPQYLQKARFNPDLYGHPAGFY